MISKEMIEDLKKRVDKEALVSNMSVSELIYDIRTKHHKKELELMDFIIEDIKNYEKRNPQLDDKISETFGEFKRMTFELKRHFEKEEFEVFPMMIMSNVDNKELLLKISDLENEHGKAEERIVKMTKLSDNFSYKKEDDNLSFIYRKMQELFADISEHESKENGVLFPRFERSVSNPLL
ncbi:hemerythrin domain-containing protein [Lachnospira multipara]|uniref:hemerythrin domain-containing protein n=1 Tax=Lachnospira multipara TaxID=28051 RepID=UPI00048189A6|nr:hemerythrin domain-containing protein [Lachnospira multipara]